jgi:hypothetical protein
MLRPGSEPELEAEVDVCSWVVAAAAVAESWQSRTPSEVRPQLDLLEVPAWA